MIHLMAIHGKCRQHLDDHGSEKAIEKIHQSNLVVSMNPHFTHYSRSSHRRKWQYFNSRLVKCISIIISGIPMSGVVPYCGKSFRKKVSLLVLGGMVPYCGEFLLRPNLFRRQKVELKSLLILRFLKVEKDNQLNVDSNELNPLLFNPYPFLFKKENQVKLAWHQLQSLLQLIILSSADMVPPKMTP